MYCRSQLTVPKPGNPQSWEVTDVCCFEIPSLGVVCYAAKPNLFIVHASCSMIWPRSLYPYHLTTKLCSETSVPFYFTNPVCLLSLQPSFSLEHALPPSTSFGILLISDDLFCEAFMSLLVTHKFMLCWYLKRLFLDDRFHVFFIFMSHILDHNVC